MAKGIVELSRRTLGTASMSDFVIRDESYLDSILPAFKNISDGSIAALPPPSKRRWILIDREWVDGGDGCCGGGGGGGGLTSVIADGVTITGNGTVASPLKLRLSTAAQQAIKILTDGLHVLASDMGAGGPAFYTGPTQPANTDLIWHQTAV